MSRSSAIRQAHKQGRTGCQRSNPLRRINPPTAAEIQPLHHLQGQGWAFAWPPAVTRVTHPMGGGIRAVLRQAIARFRQRGGPELIPDKAGSAWYVSGSIGTSGGAWIPTQRPPRKEPPLRTREILQAWKLILAGRMPSLSIEVTRECPLRCPGCYAFGDDHLGGILQPRQVQDHRGQNLIDGIMKLVEKHRPIHLSLVGGEPLVRFRELSVLLPMLEARGIHTQIVTSAVRPIPLEWREIRKLNIVVSIDGLQPEHDARRRPAT